MVSYSQTKLNFDFSACLPSPRRWKISPEELLVANPTPLLVGAFCCGNAFVPCS